MKIYISHSGKYDYKNRLYEPIKKSDLMESNIFFFPEENRNKIKNTKYIISNCELLIAEVSLPTTGQGIEIGWADCARIPIVCIHKKGLEFSSSLKLVTDQFMEYENVEDMITKIADFIKKVQK